MSYMYLILAEAGDPALGLRLMEVPVEWRDGSFVATGQALDRNATDGDIWNLLPADMDDHYPMGPVPLPEGWEMIAHFWLPTRYVPESREVASHSKREAVKYMLERGLITAKVAKQIMEDTDA